MGFDLRAINKGVHDLSMGAFSWSWMLEAGVGLPLCHGKGVTPASFVFRERPDGRCVGYNDGARVTAKEAKQMAQIARWVADYQDTLREVWMQQSEEDRIHQQDNNRRLYNVPVRQDFVDKIRAFADFAEKSGGFRVH